MSELHAPFQRRVRVLAVMDTKGVSGPARQLMSVASGLKNFGVDVCIATFVRRGERTDFAKELANARIAHVLIEQRNAYDPSAFVGLLKHVRSTRPHVIQSHGYRASVAAAVVRARIPSLKWLAFFHGATSEDTKTKFFHAVDQMAMSTADLRVSVAASLIPQMSHGSEILTIHNAVLDVSERPRMPASLTQQLAIMNRPLFGIVSRLSWEKGVDVAMEAAIKLYRSGANFGMVVVGDGPERKRLDVMLAKYAVPNSVVSLVGAHSVSSDFYGAIDTLILPSRSEGMPNVILEALSCGIPVIATDVGDVATLVQSDSQGRLVPAGEVGYLADAMTAALRDNHSSESRRDERIERVSAEFGVQLRVQRHVSAYRRLLGDPWV